MRRQTLRSALDAMRAGDDERARGFLDVVLRLGPNASITALRDELGQEG